MSLLTHLGILALCYLVSHVALLKFIFPLLKAEEMRSFSCIDASVGLSNQDEESCNPTTYRSAYDSPLAYQLLIGLNFIVVCLAFSIYSFCARDYDIECGEANYLQLALNVFRNKVKGTVCVCKISTVKQLSSTKSILCSYIKL